MTAQSGFSLINAPGAVDRVEACISGTAYAPHRHDTYAIGITLTGVQQFDYRGATRNSLRGELVVLHPDERHDGRAGDERGLRYRTAYVAPADIQAALGGQPLPFVEGGVSRDSRLRGAILALLADFDRPLTDLEHQDALYDLAHALRDSASGAGPASIANRAAALGARDYIEAHLDAGFSLGDLEHAVGHDRWQLSRDFRAIFGTSPYRYLILRRLDRARAAMRQGCGNAEAALAAGFADQSHFNRQFKRAFGLTPGGWRRAIGTHDRSRPGTPAAPRPGHG
jgi:AraC-like DNA-binding protein